MGFMFILPVFYVNIEAKRSIPRGAGKPVQECII
jgi:hypothetical protein